MDDRELLGLAALAAGMQIHESDQAARDKFGFGHIGLFILGGPNKWNPLTNDGDALRLAVTLNLDVMTCGKYQGDDIQIGGAVAKTTFQPLGILNRQEATRRAIVRAAAEVGKGMLSHEEFVLMFPDRFEQDEVDRAAEIGKAMREKGL